jgi:hypothetical protein
LNKSLPGTTNVALIILGEIKLTLRSAGLTSLMSVFKTTTGSTLGFIAYRERKLLNEDPSPRRTTEQLAKNLFPLSTRIQEAIGFTLKNGSS